MIFEKLPRHQIETCESIWCYRLGDIRKSATELHKLACGDYLALHMPDELYVEYAYYRFHISEAGNIDHDTAYYSCLLRGEGPSGSLREMRHTYFNPDEDDLSMRNYVFYLPLNGLAEAIVILKRYFEGI